MGGVMKLIGTVLIAAALIAAIATPSEAAIGCSKVVSYLNPCLPYVTGQGPLGGCCGGIQGINASKAACLPAQCGINIPYKISPSTDCSKVQ
ncbi:hypothetical protein SASPL_114424 [Salvia splendens]|uniref:Bifunctional inhibitor/plant lipid transfer protein/seed storage helical domain-containing protein n=1 Tax=Salvia splendens TaxID=180675 RepID=A0A8X8Y1V1_SALSN|nr:hypothetical protein SASPL_114424 [Salvia splendens]